MSGTTAPDYASAWAVTRDMMAGVRHGLGTGCVVAVAGDSRAAMMPWDTLGGAQVIPVGMPDATVRDAGGFIPAAICNLAPKVTVIQLGINNVWVPLTDSQWNTVPYDYAVLIAGVLAHCPHVVVTTPIPPEKGSWDTDTDTILRAGWLHNFAQNIRDAAAAQSVQVVDLCTQFSQADGTARAGATWDGIHFTAPTYAEIKATLDPIVAALLSS